jgi:hypothetical protein
MSVRTWARSIDSMTLLIRGRPAKTVAEC